MPRPNPGSELLDLAVAKALDLPEELWPHRCIVLRHATDNYDGDNGWCYSCDNMVSNQGRVPPPFSADMREAWKLIDTLKANDEPRYVELESVQDAWRCTIEDSIGIVTTALGETAPVAICRMMLDYKKNRDRHASSS